MQTAQHKMAVVIAVFTTFKHNRCKLPNTKWQWDCGFHNFQTQQMQTAQHKMAAITSFHNFQMSVWTNQPADINSNTTELENCSESIYHPISADDAHNASFFVVPFNQV